jgi:hypothetical protein
MDNFSIGSDKYKIGYNTFYSTNMKEHKPDRHVLNKDDSGNHLHMGSIPVNYKSEANK